MLARRRLTGPAGCRTFATRPPAQRRPVWMDLRNRLVPVDLPVDVVVVLEQEERAGQAQGAERALREL